MSPSQEGFLYPMVGDNCIHCGACVKQCPVNDNDVKADSIKQKGYLAITKKARMYRLTASGGVFSTLAYAFLREHPEGRVVGAAWQDGLVRHVMVSDIRELPGLANSKYVQSDACGIYALVTKELKAGHPVLFSGTPCQVAALKRFTHQNEKLTTIDLICHGVPSPLFLDNTIRALAPGANVVGFRWKHALLKKSACFLVCRRGRMRKAIFSQAAVPYFSLFSKNMSHRLSCYSCQFANLNRCGDITIGDCDSAASYPDFFPKLSKSTVIVNTPAGYNFWQVHQTLFHTHPLDIQLEAKKNRPLSQPEQMPKERETIYADMLSLTYDEMVNKYGRKDPKIKSWLLRFLDLIPYTI